MGVQTHAHLHIRMCREEGVQRALGQENINVADTILGGYLNIPWCREVHGF